MATESSRGVWSSSWLVRTAQNARNGVDDSRLVGAAVGFVAGIRRAIPASTPAKAAAVLELSLRHSALRDAAATVARWTSASWLYRWLTKEPEPDVVVIDLRETVTVGPVLRVIDVVVTAVLWAYQASLVRRGVDATARALYETPVRAAGVVLAAAVLSNLLGAAVGTGVTPTELAGHALALALAIAGIRSRRSWPELRESRPVALLVAALEPPDPPDGDDRR